MGNRSLVFVMPSATLYDQWTLLLFISCPCQKLYTFSLVAFGQGSETPGRRISFPGFFCDGFLVCSSHGRSRLSLFLVLANKMNFYTLSYHRLFPQSRSAFPLYDPRVRCSVS